MLKVSDFFPKFSINSDVFKRPRYRNGVPIIDHALDMKSQRSSTSFDCFVGC